MKVLVRMNADGGLTVAEDMLGLTFNRRGECVTEVPEELTVLRMRYFLPLPVISVLQSGGSVDIKCFAGAVSKRFRPSLSPNDCITKLQSLGGFARMVYRRGIHQTAEEDVKYIQTLYIYPESTNLMPYLKGIGAVEVAE